jgi:crotonobetaine/carnitine-CoA ligase
MLSALKYNAEWFGDRLFLVDADEDGRPIRSLTYAEFWETTRRAAQGFLAAGLKPGDRVLTLLPGSSEYVITAFGLHLAGLVHVPCSTLFKAPEIQRQLLHSGAAAVVTARATGELIDSAAEGVGALQWRFIWDLGAWAEGDGEMNAFLQAAPDGEAFAIADPGDLSMILYTSGTTADPKGVMLTHGNLLWVGELACSIYEYGRDDRVLHFFPMYHVGGGIALLMPAILCGATVVVAPRFSASRFGRMLVNSDATMIASTATMVKMILEHPTSPDDRGHRVRRSQHGLPLDRERYDRFEERFDIRLVEGYGLSESMGFVTANRVWSGRKFGSVGPPVVGRCVRIVDDEENDVPIGEQGEILANWLTPHAIMAGYYNDPEETRRTLAGGWLRTGDVGSVDDEGYCYLVDRKKDIIKRAGVNVAPAEIERVLTAHLSVADVAVVGAPDEFREEAVVAFIVLNDADTTIDELREFCARNLASYKVPETFLVKSTLPKDNLGKIDKKELRRLAAADAMGTE